MSTPRGLLAVGLALLGVVSPSAPAQTAASSQPENQFKLTPEPLPIGCSTGFTSRYDSIRPIEELPSGLVGVDAVATELDLTDTGRFANRVILAKSTHDKAFFDRLYVDTDGDGAFGSDECYDLSRSKPPVTVQEQADNGRNVILRPLKITGPGPMLATPRWIALKIEDVPNNCGISYASVTCRVAKARFDGREVLIAFYEGLPFRSEPKFNNYFVIPPEPPDAPSFRAVGTPHQILFDENGNGRFDIRSVFGVGPENQWLTRLLKVHGKYYTLDVVDDGKAIRVTPVKPQLGRVKIPPHIVWAWLVGPEFAVALTSKEKEIELPVGRYVLQDYHYRCANGSLLGSDYNTAVLQVKPAQTSTLQVGPPLQVRFRFHLPTPEGPHVPKPETVSATVFRLELEAWDCAGRRASLFTTDKSPALAFPPRYKILDTPTRIIHSGVLESHRAYCQFSWRIPESVHGTLWIVPEWPACPFEIKSVKPLEITIPSASDKRP
jgi:hypothetical protein